MIIVYIILLFIAVLLFMLLLGFIDIVYNSYERDCWRDLCCCLWRWYSYLDLVLTVCNWHVSYQKINEYAKTSDVLL